MTVQKFVTNTIKHFSTSTSGSMLPVFAFCIPVVFGTTGLAIDYSRISNEKSKLESALDSTVLNIGSKLFKKSNNGTDFRQQFEELFTESMAGRGLGYGYKVEAFNADNETGELFAKISAELDTSFMKIFGYDKVKVEAEGAAIFKQSKTEITMMLDTTGSMAGDKMKALKKAAKDAINIFLADKDADVSVGLVPYSATVNVGKNNAEIVTQNNTEVASISGFDQPFNNVKVGNCVSERSNRERATDASYNLAPIGSHNIAVNFAHCPTSEILPLTTSKTALKERINSMTAKGGTAGHLGIAWSYYMLSDKWNTLWQKSGASATAYGEAKKVAIIMTDGEFNQAYENLGGGTHVQRSNRLALELCQNMKAKKYGKEGITVYSIAFSAPESAQTLLKTCANTDTSNDTYYYAASNEKELRSAFSAIAKSISSLRLSK